MGETNVMLCERCPWLSFPKGPDWAYEPKFDGIRCLAIRHGSEIQLVGRSGEDYTKQFPEIVGALKTIQGNFVLDGELCSEGAWDFRRIAGRVHLQDPFRIELRARADPAVYWVFDVLEANGEPLVSLPLRERKEVLVSLLGQGSARVKLVPPLPLEQLVEAAEKGVIEGLVAKRLSSTYQFRRSPDWVKSRPREGEDAKIIGYETSDKPERFGIRSLILLGRHGEFQASSGLTAEDLEALSGIFSKMVVARREKKEGRELRYFASSVGEAEVVMATAPGIPVRFPRIIRLKADRR
jgi:bifunctional non-homologous end joining protein LigD